MSVLPDNLRASSLPRVAVIATGGTIANTLSGRVGIDAVLSDIRDRYPESDPTSLAQLTVREVTREGSVAFDQSAWLAIARTVSAAADDPTIEGIVVTHGTYTAEETAYFLHLVLDTTKPVVVACSQRKHRSIGNDGDRNLLDAIRVAIDPDAGGRGVMLVINEEIHSAREITKISQRPSGFSSRGLGPLGSVEADAVTFYRSPTRRHTAKSEFGIPDMELPRVDVVASYVGADGVAVEAFVAAGAAGLVVNGFAFSGMPHPLQLPALRRAREQAVEVVLVNRGGGGRIPIASDREFVLGDNLSAQKARILLALALTRTRDPAELQRIFSEY